MASKQQPTQADTVRLVHAEKGTKVRVAADAAARYLAQGFQALGSKVRTSTPILDGTPSEAWTVKDLREYAEANLIDLAGATRKGDILAVLAATADPDRLIDGQPDEDDEDLDDELVDQDPDDEDE